MAFNPSGALLIYDPSSDTVRDSGTGKRVTIASGRLLTIPRSATGRRPAFSPDGTLLATFQLFWDVAISDPATGEHVRTLPRQVSTPWHSLGPLAFSPDGAWVATADDTGTGILLWPIGRPAHPAGLVSPRWANRTLAAYEGRMAASRDAPARVLQGHSGSVQSIAFGRDGALLVTGASDGTARLWDVRSGTCIRVFGASGHRPALGKEVWASLSPRGSRVGLTFVSGTIQLSDATTGATIRTLDSLTDMRAGPLFSDDGVWLAATAADKTARIWHAGNGSPMCTLNGHEGTLTSIAFSPVGKTVATASEDTTARIWAL